MLCSCTSSATAATSLCRSRRWADLLRFPGIAAKPIAWLPLPFPADYIEIRYEDLVTNPRETLSKLGGFIDHDLDYDQIQRASLGRLSETNSSFREEGGKEKINPLGRWKERLSAASVAAIEGTVGDCLEENGYPLSLPAAERRRSFRSAWMRSMYPAFLGSKLWLKLHTPVGRFANISALELEDAEPRKLPIVPVAENHHESRS